MKEFTIRQRMDEMCFRTIEQIIDGNFADDFKEFMTKYAGLSLEEDFFLDKNGKDWIVASFDNYTSIYKLTKEFKENGWGLKVPFAYDQGGWHFCLSFEEDTKGKIIVNRWTDHLPEDQFIVIADSFEEFIEGLAERPEELT